MGGMGAGGWLRGCFVLERVECGCYEALLIFNGCKCLFFFLLVKLTAFVVKRC